MKTLPVVRQDLGEKTGQDAEFTDREYVEIDHMTQTVNNFKERRQGSIEWLQ